MCLTSRICCWNSNGSSVAAYDGEADSLPEPARPLPLAGQCWDATPYLYDEFGDRRSQHTGCLHREGLEAVPLGQYSLAFSLALLDGTGGFRGGSAVGDVGGAEGVSAGGVPHQRSSSAERRVVMPSGRLPSPRWRPRGSRSAGTPKAARLRLMMSLMAVCLGRRPGSQWHDSWWWPKLSAKVPHLHLCRKRTRMSSFRATLTQTASSEGRRPSFSTGRASSHAPLWLCGSKQARWTWLLPSRRVSRLLREAASSSWRCLSGDSTENSWMSCCQMRSAKAGRAAARRAELSSSERPVIWRTSFNQCLITSGPVTTSSSSLNAS